MNPVLLQLLQRYGPQAARFLNSSAMRLGQVQTPAMPAITPLHPAVGGPTPPISGPQPPTPDMSPNDRVSQGFGQFGPGASNGVPTMASQNLPTPMDVPPALSAHAMAPRPATPPVPADMGQAANIPIGNNYVMPAFGTPSDLGPKPASGPDVIQKLMDLFHSKGNSYETPKSENGGG